MVDKFSGMVFVVSLVLLLSFKDMLFITKNVETTATPKNAARNQPIHLDTGDDDFKSDHDDEAHDHDHHSKQGFEDDSDFDGGSSRVQDGQPSSGDGEFVKKIPSLKMKSNIQTIKFSFW
jgi:hypothetical protein